MVEEIRYVKQQGPFTYGQACIAMLTNQTTEQVIYDLNFDGPYTKSRLKCALDKYGIKYKPRRKRIFRDTRKDYSSFAILIVRCNNYNTKPCNCHLHQLRLRRLQVPIFRFQSVH